MNSVDVADGKSAFFGGMNVAGTDGEHSGSDLRVAVAREIFEPRHREPRLIGPQQERVVVDADGDVVVVFSELAERNISDNVMLRFEVLALH